MEIFPERTEELGPPKWANIDWHAVEANVRRLQERIYCATRREEWRRVRNLQQLLVKATSNKLLAIRRVTQENQGKHTAGIDGVRCDTPTARMQLFREGLSLRGYRPQPVRRVYIPKANGKQRPLGIPTMKDRVMQAMVKAALEPEWEARFETNSFGFRPGRCTMDAIEQLHTTLAKKGASQWVLDADITGCFDNIGHDALLARIPVFTDTIRQWLKTGVVELGHFTATAAGTPQGGVISPLLANIALDGMERLFGAETPDGRYLPPSRRKRRNKGIGLVRFADDFVVTAPSREVLEEYVAPRIVNFLRERGLTLNEVKTRIVHVTEGFDFLGFHIRRLKHRLLTRPQKSKAQTHVRAIKEYLRTHRQARTAQVIRELNPLIRGWATYYRYCAAKETFYYVDHQVWHAVWRWVKRRHPNKSVKWRRRRYYRSTRSYSWEFSAGKVFLLRHGKVPVFRYTKVTGHHSPYDPTLRVYWQERRWKRIRDATHGNQRRTMLRSQDYRCLFCQGAFEPEQTIHRHHVLARRAGGTEEAENIILVHSWCHHQHHQRHGYGCSRLEPDEA